MELSIMVPQDKTSPVRRGSAAVRRPYSRSWSDASARGFMKRRVRARGSRPFRDP